MLSRKKKLGSQENLLENGKDTESAIQTKVKVHC